MTRDEFTETVKRNCYYYQHGRCDVCGRKFSFENKRLINFHHKLPCEQGGTNNQTNCVMLCLDCHMGIHTMDDKHKEQQLPYWILRKMWRSTRDFTSTTGRKRVAYRHQERDIKHYLKHKPKRISHVLCKNKSNIRHDTKYVSYKNSNKSKSVIIEILKFIFYTIPFTLGSVFVKKSKRAKKYSDSQKIIAWIIGVVIIFLIIYLIYYLSSVTKFGGI